MFQFQFETREKGYGFLKLKRFIFPLVYKSTNGCGKIIRGSLEKYFPVRCPSAPKV